MTQTIRALGGGGGYIAPDRGPRIPTPAVWPGMDEFDRIFLRTMLFGDKLSREIMEAVVQWPSQQVENAYPTIRLALCLEHGATNA